MASINDSDKDVCASSKKGFSINEIEVYLVD